MTFAVNNTDQWISSLVYALLFIIVSSPLMYKLTGSLFNAMGLEIESDGCPNAIGVVIHGIVYFLLARLIMFIYEKTAKKPKTDSKLSS